MSDPVNRPAHYTGHPSGIECIDITEHLSFCAGNAVKYLWRAGKKDDLAQDLKKAHWYLCRERARCGVGFRPPVTLDSRSDGYANFVNYLVHNPGTRADAVILAIAEGRLAAAERWLAALIDANGGAA